MESITFIAFCKLFGKWLLLINLGLSSLAFLKTLVFLNLPMGQRLKEGLKLFVPIISLIDAMACLKPNSYIKQMNQSIEREKQILKERQQAQVENKFKAFLNKFIGIDSYDDVENLKSMLSQPKIKELVSRKNLQSLAIYESNLFFEAKDFLISALIISQELKENDELYGCKIQASVDEYLSNIIELIANIDFDYIEDTETFDEKFRKLAFVYFKSTINARIIQEENEVQFRKTSNEAYAKKIEDKLNGAIYTIEKITNKSQEEFNELKEEFNEIDK